MDEEIRQRLLMKELAEIRRLLSRRRGKSLKQRITELERKMTLLKS